MEERMTRERAVSMDLPFNPFSRRKVVAGHIAELGVAAPEIFFLGRVDLVMAVGRVTDERAPLAPAQQTEQLTLAGEI